MSRCLFTYESLRKDEEYYSIDGLKKLSRKLTRLQVFPYDQSQQIELAKKMVKKISIQGVQPKFSIVLSEREESFKTVENKGRYILKPQVQQYRQLPENEDLTMHLVSIAGVKVPWHGLVKCSDGSLSYVVKRFDRTSKEKISMEDFSQLIGASRSTKYDVSMEKVAEVIEQYCTFPTIEKFKLFQLVILAFLLGNEDLHLKNLSLISHAGKIQLSPVYDFVNSTIVNPHAEEEMALSILDKKRGFTREELLNEFAHKTLFLPRTKIEKETARILGCVSEWKAMVDKSFLSFHLQEEYKKLIDERAARLQ